MLRKLCLFTTIALSVFTQVSAQQTEVSIQGDAFYINGRPTYEGRYWNGHKVEGLLMNSRMVQGVFDNRIAIEKGKTSVFAYPDTGVYDADRNTREFVDAMEEWYSYGLLSFTLNLQGGSPFGYGGNEKCLNSAFNSNGSFRKDYQKRLKQILDRADELGMVVMLGYFYQGQDQVLKDEKAVYRAATEATKWILKNGYRNVMVEIANEADVKAYDHDIIKAENVHKLISHIQSITKDGRRLLVSCSQKGCAVPTEEIVRVADYVLIHGNGMKNPQQMPKVIARTRALPTYTAKPIVCNEDDNYRFEDEDSNIILATQDYVSWGFFDFRRKGDALNEGFQSVPVDWTISSDRKQQFFDAVKEITAFGQD